MENENLYTPRQILSRFGKSRYEDEKELADYLEINIRSFCRDAGYKDFFRYKREASIMQSRVDFMVEILPRKFILIECKNPRSTNDSLNAIGQILDYGLQANDLDKEIIDLWIVMTQMDIRVCNLITRYKLPINMAVLTKTEIAFSYNRFSAERIPCAA